MGQTNVTGMFAPTFRPTLQIVEQARFGQQDAFQVFASIKSQSEQDELVYQKTLEKLQLDRIDGFSIGESRTAQG